jgi:hypothetical protein
MPYPVAAVRSKNFGSLPILSELIKGYFGAGLIAYWKMDEASGNLVDSSGNGFTATAGGSGTSYQSDTLPNGNKVLSLNGSGYFSPYTTAFRDAFNFNSGSIVVIIKIPTQAAWQSNGGVNGTLINLRGAGGNIISLSKIDAGGISGARVSSGYGTGSGRIGFSMIGMTWNTATGLLKHYADGRLTIPTNASQIDWSDTLSSTYTKIGTDYNGGSARWKGSLGHLALGTTVLTDAQMKSLFENLYPSTRGLFIVGDSKATGVYMWPGYVCNGLEAALGGTWIEKPKRYGMGGYDIEAMKLYIDANLAAETDVPEKIIINIGTNDARKVTITAEAPFKASFQSVINSLQSKWPGVPIYVAKIWRGDDPVTITNSGIINGYIDWVIAQYGSGVYAGLNEAVTLENGDAGATYYQADKIHPNVLSQPLQATTWLTAMGY